jgi:serine protease Do
MKNTVVRLSIIASFLFVQSVWADLPDFSSLVKKNGPSVVNISSVQKVKNNRSFKGSQGEEVPDILRYFFGDGFQHPPQDKKSLGSGFIISDDGYILTNNHVVENADEVLVRLQDRRELNAVVVGTDAKSDLALLKIEANKLPSVKIGKSEDLEVGEWVLAIGSPFGFEASATKGIVSHLGRALPSENYVPFIQTDVPINPGNSGGPLFNLDGEVVGINSQIYSRTGGFMGLSFAIPIDTAMSVVKQIKQHGKVQRGWLGVVIQEVNRDLADSFGLEKPGGALVAQVLDSSPAQEAGLKEGDVILTFDSKEIELSSDLPVIVGVTLVDTLVDVKILRDKKTRILKVRIGALPEEDGQVQIAKADQAISDKLGLIVQAISEQQEERWLVSLGVAVREVLGEPARSAGILPGDIITQVNNREVDSLEKYQKVIRDLAEDKWVPVLVYRRGKPIYVPVYISKSTAPE